MTTPECPHEWSRRLSDPGTPACRCCGVPYNADTHNPALPDVDPPVRSFSDMDIEVHEAPEHSAAWEAFGATPGGEEIERVGREAA